MLRSLLCSFVVLGLCTAVATADTKNTKENPKSTKNAKDKKHEATITKVDTKKGTITVRMHSKDGKDHERTFKLTEDIRYFDSTGRVAAIDVFRSGDEVLVVDREGQLREVHKNKAAGVPDKAKANTGNKTKEKKAGTEK